MNKTFDFNRFSLLLKRELWSGNKKPLIIVGAILGLLAAYSLFTIYTNDGYKFINFNLFPILLIIGGLIFTSVIYYEFNDKTGTHHYLSLPTSTFEKYLSKWVITAIVFPIITTLLFWGFTKITDGIYYNYSGEKFSSWSPFNWWSIFFIQIYFVLQPTYLVGAIAFQKYTFFKTSLSAFLTGLLLTAIGLLIFRILFSSMFDGLFTMSPDKNMPLNEDAIYFMEHTFQSTLIYACWILVPLVMWTVGFFKLKEKEA